MDTQLLLAPTTSGDRPSFVRQIRYVRDWCGTAGLVVVLIIASVVIAVLERQRSKDTMRYLLTESAEFHWSPIKQLLSSSLMYFFRDFSERNCINRAN
jgi:hypothetical protein